MYLYNILSVLPEIMDEAGFRSYTGVCQQGGNRDPSVSLWGALTSPINGSDLQPGNQH